MAKKNSIFSHWIFSEYKSVNAGLPIYRVIFALFVLITIMPRYLWIDSYPDTFFFPRLGPTLFFTGFPDIYFFYLLNFLLILSLLFLLVGYKTFYSSIAVALLFFIGNAWEYSFNKINHDILLLLIPLLLAFSTWGKKLSSNINVSRNKIWPISTFALLISLAMLTAGIAKLISGWLDPSNSALAGHLVRNYFVTERATLLGQYLLLENNFYIFKFLEYGTVIIECAFIFTVFSLRYFRLTCAFACLFHLGVQLTMGISFTTNIIAYALVVNWSYMYKFATVKNVIYKFEQFISTVGLVKSFSAAVLLWAFYVFIGNPFVFDPGLDQILGSNIINTLFMIAGAMVSLIYIGQMLPVRIPLVSSLENKILSPVVTKDERL